MYITRSHSSRLLLPLALLSLSVLGCARIQELANSAKSPSSGNTNSAEPKNTGTSSGAVTGGDDPKQEIIEASRRFIELPFFTAKMDGMGQSELKMQVAYAEPDRFHVTYLAGTGAGMEIIFIGKDMYMKTGGTWRKSPGAVGDSIPNLRDSFTEEGLKTLSDVKFEGEDEVDGKDAFRYSYKNVTPKGNFPFSSKIWVSQDTGVPMKIAVDYDNGVLKHMNVNYDTETPVTIEPPIK